MNYCEVMEGGLFEVRGKGVTLDADKWLLTHMPESSVEEPQSQM